MNIDEVEIGLCLKSLFPGGGADFDNCDDGSAFRQFLDAATDGGQGGFIADEQVPILGRWDDH